MRSTSPSFQPGHPSIRTAIVLSTPGRAEEAAGRPAAGRIGSYLNVVLARLHAADPDRFPYPVTDDYRILNAVREVHFQARSGRSEGTSADVRDPENLRRVGEQLAGMGTVLAIGRLAELAVRESQFPGVVLQNCHLSLRSLNMKYSSRRTSPAERTRDRLEQYAADLVLQLRRL